VHSLGNNDGAEFNWSPNLAIHVFQLSRVMVSDTRNFKLTLPCAEKPEKVPLVELLWHQ